ncbi:hypothetical protein RsTz2092_04840 [Deferribacterales bacterium RsTz2092]
MFRFMIKSSRTQLENFWFMWGKSVIGFDSRVHCAKCLIGDYDRQLTKNMKTNHWFDISLTEGSFFYICGVSTPYIWKNNAHLPVVVKGGAMASLKLYNGDILVVDGAEQLPFDDSVAVKKYSHLGKKFTTCRNFQFGAHYFDCR